MSTAIAAASLPVRLENALRQAMARPGSSK